MATMRSIIPHRSSGPRIILGCESRSSILNLDRQLEFSAHKDRSCFVAINGGLRRLRSGRRARRNGNSKMDLVVYSSVQPEGAPLSPNSPPASWKSWIVGTLITFILPFLRYKWGPIFKLTKEVEAAVESVEHVTEVIEKVTEEVEKVTEEIADELPEGGKPRDAVESVENAAREVAKDAQLIEDVIDKVEEVVKEVESYMEPSTKKASETLREANDQK